MTFEQDSVTLYRLGDFGAWLIAADIALPECWYTHGWIRLRLTALMEWREKITDPAGADRWWGDLFAMTATAQWRDVLGHKGLHLNHETHNHDPVSSFEATVSAIQRAKSVVPA